MRWGLVIEGKVIVHKPKKVFLILLCLYPALVSLVAVYLELSPSVFYTVGKIIMVVIPLVVWVRSGKSLQQIRMEWGFSRTNGLVGLTSGATLACIILVVFYSYLQPYIDPHPIIEKMSALGLIRYYWAVALFMAFVNSFIEEYYWRSFILSEWLYYYRKPLLVTAINGAFFAVHHFVVLLVLVPIPLVCFFAIASAIAGLFWTWLRVHRCSIIDCYISHIITDVAIFWAGWELIR